MDVQIFIILFIISATVKILFLEFYWSDISIPKDDEHDYIATAMYINSGNSWISEDAPNSRPLLLSLIISPFLDLGIYPIRILLILISSITPFLMYSLSKKAFNLTSIQSVIPALIWIFYPPEIWYSGLILTESLTGLLALGSTLCFIMAKDSNKITTSMCLGVLLGCLILTKSSYVYLPVLLVGLNVFIKFRCGYTMLNITQTVLVIGIIGIVTSPVIIRNYNTIESILPIESRMPYGMVVSNGDFTSPLIQNGAYDKNIASAQKIVQMKQQGDSYNVLKSYALSVVLTQIQTNPGQIHKILISRTYNFWGSRPDPFNPSITMNDIIMSIIWIPILLLFISSFRFYKSLNFWIFVLIVIYAFLTTILFWSSPRFRFPVDGLIILISTASGLKWGEGIFTYWKQQYD